MWKRVFWIALVLLAAAGVGMLLRPRPVPVDVAGIARGTVRAFVEEEGKTRIEERFIVAAPVAGRLRRVTLDEGDTVAEGQLVASIDPLQLVSRVEETKARIRALKSRLEGVERKLPKPEELERARLQVLAAEEALQIAERELEEAEAAHVKAKKDTVRATELLETSSGTEAELDAAVSVERQAEARVRAAKRRLEVRRLDIEVARLDEKILAEQRRDFDWEKKDYAAQTLALEASLKAVEDDAAQTQIHAPAAGTVLNVFEESARAVAAGAPILELGDLEALEVEADFLSEDVAHMEAGMPAEIFGRALGDTVLPGKVTRIYPSAFKKISSLGVEQQRVKVVVGFEAGRAGLGDRYRVEVRIVLAQREDAVLVPEGALFRHREGWAVFRVVDGEAVRTPVRTGIRNGRVREVLEGLEPGDRVVLHPDTALEDGAPVAALD